MNDESKKFREKYKADIDQNQQVREINNEYQVNRNSSSERLSAPKGTAHNAKQKTKNKNVRLKIASLILAAGIGVGALTAIGTFGREPHTTITEMQEMGIDTNEMGLQDDTAEMMEKYDKYFENFEGKTAELTEQGVIDMIKEIETLNFNVIKDKMADLRGVERDDVRLHYSFDKGNGVYSSAVIINEGEYDKEEIYNNRDYIFGIGKKNTIPSEISDLIVQIGEYEDITDDVKSDKITKANAVKGLKKLYEKISQVATKEFVMDDNGNVILQDYEKQTEKERDD